MFSDIFLEQNLIVFQRSFGFGEHCKNKTRFFQNILERVDTALGWCFAKAPQSMSSVVSSVYIIQVYFQGKENEFSSLPFELTKVCDFQDWSAKSLG